MIFAMQSTEPNTEISPAARAFAEVPQQGVRVRVKICGITCAADAEAAIAAGADALGFNAWSGSKRYLDLSAAGGWIRDLPGFVTKVVLCVNHSIEDARRLGALPFVDLVQFHGDESDDFCARYAADGRAFVRAVRLGAADEIARLNALGTRQVLLDATVPGAYGGTGARADWGLAAEAVRRSPGLALTLAGGLEPGNVAEAVRLVRPYAVDVASGVESEPGRKDFFKMRDFVQAALGTA
jgi:phosphoribosylanthranilate isomerase